MSFTLPWVLLGVVLALIVANVLEFRSKRRADAALVAALESGTAEERVRLAQYRQVQNIEQLLHIAVTLLLANLVATLWA